jgi:hypothetical protein
MMSSDNRRPWVVAIALVVAAWTASTAGTARGQTGPSLLVNPWATGQAIDTSSDVMIRAATHTDSGQYAQINDYHSEGRWRVLPDSDASPRLGYEVLDYDINSSDRSLPSHLWNASIGFAQPVARLPDNFFAVITAAVGYAGNKPFSDGDAYYATANLLIGKQFSDDKALIFDLNYDGNRTFLPDVPIPALEYKDRVNEYLSYTIGAPINQITYTPLTGLQIDAGWSLVTTFSARVGYKFAKPFELYGEYVDRLTGFHISANNNSDSRQFFQERRVGAGMSWKPTRLISVGVLGGWAFQEELYQGYDVRKYQVVRHFADGVYGSVQIDIGF